MTRRLTLSLILLALLVVASGVTMAQPPTLLRIARAVERRAAGLEERRGRFADHEWAWLEGGEGEPMLLIHGFNADKDNWTRLARRLDGHRLVIPDLPGHGQSQRDPEARYDVASQVGRLAELHRALGLEPAHLVGNSMGGHIAALFALEHPDRVATLTLIDAAGVRSPQPSELSQRLEAGHNPLIARDAEEYDALLEFLFVEPPYMPDAVKGYFARQAIEHQAFSQKIWEDLFAWPAPLRARLPTLEAPTLVIWGDSDRVIHPSAAQVFAEAIPDAELVVLERTGHAPMIERPDEVAALLRAHTGAAEE